MKIGILFWNVRGDIDKRKVVKSMIKSQSVDLVCLQKTKIQEMSIGLVRNLGVGKCIDWEVVNSRGAIRRVLVF